MSISHFTSKLGEFYRIEEYNIFSDLDMYINGNDEEKNYLELLDKIKKDFFDFKNNIQHIAYKYTNIKKKISQYNNYEVANCLLSKVTSKNQDDYFRNAMIAILKVLDIVEKKDIKFECCQEDIAKQVYKDTAAFLYHLLFQILEFTESVISIKENKNYNTLYSRKRLHAKEVFSLARRLPRYRVYYDDIAQQPESTFLIRQAIELRTMELLGIHSVVDGNTGQPIKITPDRFIELLHSPEVFLPENLTTNLIKKIHTWTNRFVHTGISYYQWQTEFFWEVLSPFIFDEITIDDKYMREIPKLAKTSVNEDQRDNCRIIMSQNYINKYGDI